MCEVVGNLSDTLTDDQFNHQVFLEVSSTDPRG
jgi:hypothetical protein